MNTTSDTRRTTRAAARGFVRAGSAAAPFLVVVWAIQALVRPGYDVTRHPMSLLALGDGGFVQTANFIITGLLVLALARGFQLLYTDGRGRRAIPVLVSLMGIGLIAAGIFPTDAGAGFPAGAPEGMPQFTPIGILHEIAYAVVMVSYTVATVVLVLRFRRDHDRTMQWVTIGVFVLVVVLSRGTAPGELPDPDCHRRGAAARVPRRGRPPRAADMTERAGFGLTPSAELKNSTPSDCTRLQQARV